MNARIVERTAPDGAVTYVIQQQTGILKRWLDAIYFDPFCEDYVFTSLDEAKKNLCWFDDTPWRDRVVE